MTNNNDPSAVVGRVASGIYILTAGTGDRATGMLTSWVMQAGFEPLMVTVAVHQERPVCEWLTDDQPFVLNVVGDGQKNLLAHFGKGFAPGENAFEGIELTHCPRGVPILSECLGHMECEPVGHVASEGHRIFLAKVARGSCSDGEPMVQVRKDGRHY